MYALILSFLLTHAPQTTLNAWATDTVIAYGQSHPTRGFGPHDVWGSYDWCDGHAVDHVCLENDENGVAYPHEVLNACAVVLYGGEY